MVVPTGSSAAVTFTVTVDGTDYTATSPAVSLAMGTSYGFTLTLNSSFLTVSSFGVSGWRPVTGESLGLDKVQLTWGNAPNGVYAVSAEGFPLTVANADESCIAVALVVNDAPEPQRLMIEKMGNYNKSYTTYYWGYNLQGTDVSGFTGMSQVGGGLTGVNGYLGSSGNYGLNQDYTTWTSGALSDFDGKGNTADMFNAYSENNQTMKSQDICLNLSNFNDGYSAYGNNQGYPDWYVPACGQLALMCLNMAEINTALTAIGGNNIASDKYWSTTEYSTTGVWCLDFYDGEVMYEANKFKEHRVRFVRDVGSTISFTINEVTCYALPGMTWAEWVESIYNPNENVYVINGNYIYHIGAMSMDEIQGVTPGDVIVAGQHYTHNVYTGGKSQ